MGMNDGAARAGRARHSSKLDVMPDVLVTGGGGAIEGLAAAFMRSLNGNGDEKKASKS